MPAQRLGVVLLGSENSHREPHLPTLHTGSNVYVRDLQTNTTQIATVTPAGGHDIPVPGISE